MSTKIVDNLGRIVDPNLARLFSAGKGQSSLDYLCIMLFECRVWTLPVTSHKATVTAWAYNAAEGT